CGQRHYVHDVEDVVRDRRTADQRVAALDLVAFLHFEHLRLGDQILDRIAFFRNDRDLALRLVILDEFNAAADLRDNAVVLRNARFEQLGNTRQTAGDVARLRRFAADTRQNVARLHFLTVLDRQHRADREQVARGFARLVVEQGQARLEVFLLGAARRAIFDHDALGDARRFVDLFDQRLAVGQILILHDALLFGDERHGERIPFGNPVALLHLLAVLVHDLRTIGQLVGRALAAFAVDDRDLARTRQRQTAAALVDDRRHVAIFDRAVRNRFGVR